MATALTFLFDFSRVLLHPKDSSYAGKLNDLYRSEKSKPTFQFFDFFTVDGELLSWLEKQKDTVQLALYTSEEIQNDPAVLPRLSEVFGERIFSAKDLGLSKSKSMDYLTLAVKLDALPQQIIFVDDTISNIQAAMQAGLQCIQFYSREQIQSALVKKVQEGEV